MVWSGVRRGEVVALLLAVFVAVVGWGGLAKAQESASPVPEKYKILGPGNVNVTTGAFNVSFNDIKMPSAGLSLTRKYSTVPNGMKSVYSPMGMGMTHDYNIFKLCSPCGPTNEDNGISVVIGDEAHSFFWPSDLLQVDSDQGDGAVMEYVDGHSRYRAADGTLIYFEGGTCGLPADSGSACVLASEMVLPNGRRILFEYEPGSQISNSYGQTRLARLKRVYDPNGLGLEFSYMAPDSEAILIDSKRQVVTKIEAYDVACPTCSRADLPSISYGYVLSQDYGGRSYLFAMTSATDRAGATSTYGYSQSALASVRLPTAPDVDQFVNTYQSDGYGGVRVISQTNALGGLATYSYVDTPSTKTFTVSVNQTDGGLTQYVHTYATSYASDRFDIQPARSIDPLNRTTAYVYDGYKRLTQTTSPELDVTIDVKDTRGNVTEHRLKPKPGSTAADIVTTWTYPACSLSNFRICNQPTTMVDPRGNQTDYVYAAVHGGLLSEAGPADAAGVRRLTSYAYTPYTAGGSTFYLRTAKTERISASESTTTTFGYDPARKYAVKETVTDSGGLNLRTCFANDAQGRVVGKTEPKAGLGSCP